MLSVLPELFFISSKLKNWKLEWRFYEEWEHEVLGESAKHIWVVQLKISVPI